MKYKYGVIKIKDYKDGEVRDFELIKVVDFNPLDFDYTASVKNSVYLNFESNDNSNYINDYNSDIFYNWSVTENYLSFSLQDKCELDALSNELEKIYSLESRSKGDN